VSDGGFVGAGEGETKAGHVVVDRLILAGGDLVGFVPDADGAVVADALVEGLPGGEVGGVAGLRVVDEVVEAAPVLGDHDSAPVEGGETAEEAEGRVGVKLVEHGAHGFRGGEPLAWGEEAVDAKADEEDDEGAFDAGGVTAWMESGHMGRTIQPDRIVLFEGRAKVRGSLEGPPKLTPPASWRVPD
jgi:hypothetical protein